MDEKLKNLMEITPDEMTDYNCPKCGALSITITHELNGHHLGDELAYELIHCTECCTYFKSIWKHVGLIELVEKEVK